MKELIINETQNTPGVNFNPFDGILEIEGKSIPEKPDEFYNPLLDWINQYFEDIEDNHYIRFDINNPSSENKTCFLNLTFANKQYAGTVNISANSKEASKTKVDMPLGKTEVKLDYICS